MENPSQCHRASPAIWDLIVTCHLTQANAICYKPVLNLHTPEG